MNCSFIYLLPPSPKVPKIKHYFEQEFWRMKEKQCRICRKSGVAPKWGFQLTLKAVAGVCPEDALGHLQWLHLASFKAGSKTQIPWEYFSLQMDWHSLLSQEQKGFLFACFLYGGSLKCAKLNSSVVFPENDPLFLGNLLSSPVAQMVKTLPAVWETWVQSLGQEDPLEKGKATYSSTLAWRIPWTEEPGRLQSMGWQRAWHDWATQQRQQQQHYL